MSDALATPRPDAGGGAKKATEGNEDNEGFFVSSSRRVRASNARFSRKGLTPVCGLFTSGFWLRSTNQSNNPNAPATSMITNSNPTPMFTASRWRRIFCLLFFVAATAAAIGAIASSRAGGSTRRGEAIGQRVAPAQKIAPWVTEHTANGQRAEFFVVLADQADLSGAESFGTKDEKARYVHNTLVNKSQATQEPILQWLRDGAIEHQSYYIVNAILVTGTRQVAEALAARADVARIEGNPLIHNNLPQPGPVEKSLPKVPATIEPGIAYTHAPDVWALGFTGQNIVIASADTGVRWTHNALKPHYRGWDGMNANHNYNWHDSIHDSTGNPCGNDSPFPCDDFFHGSHTTGTAIGDDGMGNQIGMAPGAKWIGCRNMDQGNGTPARYMECMEFFLAPYPINCTPDQGDPTKAPDITINSWSCPTSEGCSADTLEAAVAAQAAAGIMMVAAAQNGGPSCSTVTDPPGIYAEAYSVGALATGTDTIASFSSRGPVTVDGSNRIKPDICAPGTGTRSCSNTADNAYTTASGTSMATPHISGAMALLWCALPSFRHQITMSRDALDNAAVFISSTACGDAGPPNNVYGWGRVNIAAAVGTPSPTPSPTPTPTATGTPSACGAGNANTNCDGSRRRPRLHQPPQQQLRTHRQLHRRLQQQLHIHRQPRQRLQQQLRIHLQPRLRPRRQLRIPPQLRQPELLALRRGLVRHRDRGRHHRLARETGKADVDNCSRDSCPGSAATGER